MPADDVDVLEAAAYLERDALPDLVRGLLQGHIRALRADPSIKELLRLRAEQDATKSGVLSPLEAKRRSAQGGEY